MYLAGAVINVFIAGWGADKYGRKWAFHYCSILALLGGGLITGATGSGMFIAGRLFSGAGSVGYLAISETFVLIVNLSPQLTLLAPFYSAELAPPGLRGLMVGMNGVNIAFGYALASYMGIAFFYSSDPATQWRAPLGIALVWPLVMIGVCFIVPESPRFLLMKGRVEEAREVVYRLHAVRGDSDQQFARNEFYQMSKQAEIDREMTPSWVCLISLNVQRVELNDDDIDRDLPQTKLSEESASGCWDCFLWTGVLLHPSAPALRAPRCSSRGPTEMFRAIQIIF